MFPCCKLKPHWGVAFRLTRSPPQSSPGAHIFKSMRNCPSLIFTPKFPRRWSWIDRARAVIFLLCALETNVPYIFLSHLAELAITLLNHIQFERNSFFDINLFLFNDLFSSSCVRNAMVWFPINIHRSGGWDGGRSMSAMLWKKKTLCSTQLGMTFSSENIRKWVMNMCALYYLHTSTFGVYRKPSKHLSKAIYHFYFPFKRIKLKFVKTRRKNGLKKMKNHMAGWWGGKRLLVAGESTQPHNKWHGTLFIEILSSLRIQTTRAYH